MGKEIIQIVEITFFGLELFELGHNNNGKKNQRSGSMKKTRSLKREIYIFIYF